MFRKHINDIAKVYIDDIVVKSLRRGNHIIHQEKAFSVICICDMGLNPVKMHLQNSYEEISGFHHYPKGINVCPNQIKALLKMPLLHNIRIWKLTTKLHLGEDSLRGLKRGASHSSRIYTSRKEETRVEYELCGGLSEVKGVSRQPSSLSKTADMGRVILVFINY